MHTGNPFEYYETPAAFTRWLFMAMAGLGDPITGRIFEPCVGRGAIVEAANLRAMEFGRTNHWFTNDLDESWPADVHKDARDESLWTAHEFDWVVSNLPFEPAIEILEPAIRHARVGVAVHLRGSIHEVLKRGRRMTWMADHLPTGILWLPRWAYQRSPTTGKWATDNAPACWVVWLKPYEAHDGRNGGMVSTRAKEQFIRYFPAAMLDQLRAEKKPYRDRMDAIAGAAV